MSEEMRPKAVLFDLYNTLIDIHTVEHADDVWQRMSLFFSYHGVDAGSETWLDFFRRNVLEQQRDAAEQHPEINMHAIFTSICGDELAPPAVQLFRVLSMRRIGLFPDTLPCLQTLHGSVKLGLVSDAQKTWLMPEMRQTGIDSFFDVRIVSSDYGFRKPDPRLFQAALEQLGVEPHEVVMVGDSAYRDVGGAQGAGIRGCLLTRHAPFEPQDAMVTPDLMFPNLVDFLSWMQGAAKGFVAAT